VVQEEKPAEEEVPDIKVDAKTVKELRGTSGAGMVKFEQPSNANPIDVHALSPQA